MNYLTGYLLSATFPETAPKVYGLSKSEFASEPDIATLAQRNGLLVAATALGHVERVRTFLKNPRLRATDIHKAVQKACEKNLVNMTLLLLEDNRLEKEPFQLQKRTIGQFSPDLAYILLASSRIRFVPNRRDILYAAFAPYEDPIPDARIHVHDLPTFEMLLKDDSYNSVLKPSFCQEFCHCVESIEADGNWQIFGEPVTIPWFKDGNFVSFTDFGALCNILRKDARFAPFMYGHGQL